MTPTVRNIVLTVVLAALAGAAGAAVSARYAAGRPESTPSMHDVLHHELDLSPDQDRRLEAVEDRFAARRAALTQEMQSANSELARAIRNSDRYGPEVQSAVEHFHSSMGDLQKETVLHMFEMRSLLTPEQAARFDQRVGEALTQESR